jgi:hypothetical protein
MKLIYSLYAQIQPVETFCLVGYTGTRGEAENAIKRFFELYSGSSFVPSFEMSIFPRIMRIICLT